MPFFTTGIHPFSISYAEIRESRAYCRSYEPKGGPAHHRVLAPFSWFSKLVNWVWAYPSPDSPSLGTFCAPVHAAPVWQTLQSRASSAGWCSTAIPQLLCISLQLPRITSDCASHHTSVPPFPICTAHTYTVQSRVGEGGFLGPWQIRWDWNSSAAVSSDREYAVRPQLCPMKLHFAQCMM